MENRNRRLLLGALLAVTCVSILITVFSYGYFRVQADETNLAWVAKQVAMGRVPYADFFSFLPPLTLYGLGAFFKAFGASLANLRLLSLVWITLLDLVLYALFLRSKVPPLWSFAAALSVPAVYVPYWPVPSHHWFALGFGLLALLMIWKDSVGPADWFFGGFLAALSGLCLQTEGAFFAAFIGLSVLLARGPGKRKNTLSFLGGLAVPLGLFLLILVAQGNLGWAWNDLVVWPMNNYKQYGGFNDINPFRFISNEVVSTLPNHLSYSALAPFLLLSAALFLPILAVFWPGLSPEWTSENGTRFRRWGLNAAGILLCLTLYLRGRADWVHLVLWAPVLLLLVARSVNWTDERLRALVLKVWLSAVLVIAILRWPAVWVKRPPVIANVLSIDRMVVKHGPPSELARLPGVLSKRLPVVYLGGYGSSLYFFWAPVPPPLDWVMPPSERYDSPWDYRLMAAFLRESKIPYIMIPNRDYASFLNDPSALKEVLRKDYLPYTDSPFGKVLIRKPDAPPSSR